jgi:hypothetical protein
LESELKDGTGRCVLRKVKEFDKDKPEGFELSKYDELLNLNSSSWATQLAIRHYYYFNANGKLTNEEISLELRELINQPIIIQPPDDNPEHIDEYRRSEYSKLYQENIRPLTCLRLHMLHDMLPPRYIDKFFIGEIAPSKRDELFYRYANNLVDETCAKYHTFSWGGRDTILSGIKYIDVNLYASDKELISDFIHYLREASYMQPNQEIIRI